MVSAIVLAAGQSKRMGQPKMALPWGNTTVIGQVVKTLLQATLQEIVVVTGGAKEQVEHALEGLPVRFIYNPDYGGGEMLHSLQTGLAACGEDVDAALVTLGDQPQMELDVVQLVIADYERTRAALVVPSYQMRRGHPWIIARSLWPEVLSLRPPATMRSLFSTLDGHIHYVLVGAPTILLDLDTPEDYQRYLAGKSG
jgi:molybdenum cofactor cytidylyltransferase